MVPLIIMIYLYTILTLYLIGPLRLIYLSLDYFKNRTLPTQEKALSILRTSRLVWVTIVPVGPILVIGLILDSAGKSENPTMAAWLVITTFIATLLLPYYSLSNTGKLYRATDYKKLILVANSPFVGILLLVVHFIVISIF